MQQGNARRDEKVREPMAGVSLHVGYTQTINKVVQTCQATRQTGTDDLRVKFERNSRTLCRGFRYNVSGEILFKPFPTQEHRIILRPTRYAG